MDIDAAAAFEDANLKASVGDEEGALQALERGLILEPYEPHPVAWSNRGHILFNMGALFDALQSFMRAWNEGGNAPDVATAIGACYQRAQIHDKALEWYEIALELDPHFQHAWFNKAALIQPHDNDKAIAILRNLVAVHADPKYHVELGLCLIRAGEFEEGFREYEWRAHLPDHCVNGRRVAFPTWDGLPSSQGGRLLIYGECGFGDTLQFMRHVQEAAVAFDGPVILEVRPQLFRLARESLSGVKVIAVGDPIPDGIEASVGIMSLTHLLDAALSSPPYLTGGSAEARLRWMNLLRQLPKGNLRVGLCWAGMSRQGLPLAAEIDRRRSISLDALLPLAEIPGVSFVSLQDGPPAMQALRPPPGLVIAAGYQFDDFYDTASLVSQLDLVIAVDTAVAHLAAGIGVETWLLSRYDNCWRWMGDRTDSPWYPSLRQFRQPKWGAWGPVIAHVAAALRDRVKKAA